MPVGDLSGMPLKSVSESPGPRTTETFGKRGLGQQLKLLGRVVLDCYKVATGLKSTAQRLYSVTL